MTSWKRGIRPVSSEEPSPLFFQTRYLHSNANGYEYNASPVVMGFAIAILLFCKFSCCFCEPSRWRLLTVSPPNITLAVRRWRRRGIRERRLRAMGIIQDGATLDESPETIKKKVEHAVAKRQNLLSTFQENQVELVWLS